jgi:COP9 signalosome complex subunit 1
VPAAFKGYVRSRDYCTSPRQVVDMCLAVIRCAVENGGFVHVSNYVSKARA